MSKKRQLDDNIKRFEQKVKEIGKTFKPSTAFDEGELITTDFNKWHKDVAPKQMLDWDQIWKCLLRGYKKGLPWQAKGWAFNYYAAKFNWKGWGINEAIAFRVNEMRGQK